MNTVGTDYKNQFDSILKEFTCIKT